MQILVGLLEHLRRAGIHDVEHVGFVSDRLTLRESRGCHRKPLAHSDARRAACPDREACTRARSECRISVRIPGVPEACRGEGLIIWSVDEKRLCLAVLPLEGETAGRLRGDALGTRSSRLTQQVEVGPVLRQIRSAKRSWVLSYDCVAGGQFSWSSGTLSIWMNSEKEFATKLMSSADSWCQNATIGSSPEL